MFGKLCNSKWVAGLVLCKHHILEPLENFELNFHLIEYIYGLKSSVPYDTITSIE